MSSNKLKYWEVSTTRIVKANNKADALAAVNRKPANGGRVLGTMTSVDQISAVEANEMVAELA